MYNVHALVGGCLANLRMAVTFIRMRYSELARRTRERTEVGNTDTACEVEQLLAGIIVILPADEARGHRQVLHDVLRLE